MFEDAPIIETRAVNEREQVASMPMFAYRRKKKAKEKNNDYDDDYPYRS